VKEHPEWQRLRELAERRKTLCSRQVAMRRLYVNADTRGYRRCDRPLAAAWDKDGRPLCAECAERLGVTNWGPLFQGQARNER